MILRTPFLAACLVTTPLFAQETYEVTTPRLLETFMSNKEVLTHKDIETYQETFVNQALSYTSSLTLTGNRPVGQFVDFSMRGARSSQNLVLLDGIYVNNPASGGSVDLADFLTADMEKIEVLPGPQNLAYGPGALGGVIQLIPKKGHGKPSLKAKAEGGSFKTRQGTITAQGEDGPLQFSVVATGFLRGPSAFTNPLHGNRQGDNYRNGTLSSRVGYAMTDNWEIEGLIRYTERKVQFDGLRPQAGVFLPFEAQNFTNSQILLTSFENKWGTECADHSLRVSYSQTNRKTDSPSFHNMTIGEHPLLTYKTEVKLNSQNSIQLGLDGGQERAKESALHKRTHGGIFFIHAYKPFIDTTLRAGIRGDHYEFLGSRITFSVGAEQKLTSTTLFRTSFGTNFKPPVLSDLFQKTPWQMPNPFLKPEKSQSLEVGIDQTLWKDKIIASFTGFLTRIDQITLSKQFTNGAWQRFNGGRRIAKGVETALSLKPINTLEVKVTLTFTQARDFPNKEKSPFIPGVKGALGANWQIFPDFSVFAQFYGVTTRKDSVTKRNLAPYGLVNIGSAYEVNSHANFFWRIENLTNKYFEDVFGYGVRGRTFFFGIEAKT